MGRLPLSIKEKDYDQRTAPLTPEERAIREENLAARPGYRIDGIRALYAAVALRTVKDYKGALIAEKERRGKTKFARKNRNSLLEECEEFFNSEAFGEITNGLTAADVYDRLMENDMDMDKVNKISRGRHSWDGRIVS